MIEWLGRWDAEPDWKSQVGYVPGLSFTEDFDV
jgi:hypothetical protein